MQINKYKFYQGVVAQTVLDVFGWARNEILQANMLSVT